MKKRIKSTVWDNMHYFFEAYNDHSIRAEIMFASLVDINLFLTALTKTIELVPIVKSKWVVKPLRTYWEIIEDFDVKDCFKFIENGDNSLHEKFMTEKIEEKNGAQIKVMLFRKDGKDSLTFIFNHQTFDGSAVKEFLSLLARYYSGLEGDKNFEITDFKCGDRQFKQLYENFTFKEKLKLAFRINYGKKNAKRLGFPYEKNPAEKKKEIIKSDYTSEFFLKLKEKSKVLGVTLNDIFLAAYALALSDINMNNSGGLEIDCVYDLRKYIEGGKTKGLTNMVSKIALPLEGISTSGGFIDAVLYVHDLMERFKSDYPGMDGLSLLRFCFAIIPFPALRRSILYKVFNNPMAALSNIGLIGEEVVRYGALKTDKFFITGAIKYQPYTLLSLFTFRNELHINTTVDGSDKDIENAKKMLRLIGGYLEAL